MKQSKISRRSFLLGLGAVSAAAVLTLSLIHISEPTRH